MHSPRRVGIVVGRVHLHSLIKAIAAGDARWWNYWRIDHPQITPDLRGVDLRGVNLSLANFSGVNLSGANLSGTNLYHANLRNADLRGATLVETVLCEADMSGANLCRADLRWANLTQANLSYADCRTADLSWADLSRSNLRETNLNGSILRETEFSNTQKDPSRALKMSARLTLGVTRLERAALRLIRRRMSVSVTILSRRSDLPL